MNAVLFALRPVEQDDEPFLYRLYRGTHGQQFAMLPLVPAQRENLVRMQFNAQRTSYRLDYPGSQDFLIFFEGEPVGHVWLDESPARILIVDIAILAERQGQGFGTSVLQNISGRAARDGKRVRLRVDRMNVGAARLYRRLGFQVISGDEVSEEMEMRPE